MCFDPSNILLKNYQVRVLFYFIDLGKIIMKSYLIARPKNKWLCPARTTTIAAFAEQKQLFQFQGIRKSTLFVYQRNPFFNAFAAAKTTCVNVG